MFRPNRVQSVLEKDGRAIGCFIQSPNPDAVETAGHVGYDFVIIDMEHGAFGYETALELIRAAEAAGTTPIVRLLQRDPISIGQILDSGARGIIVPRVRTAEDVREAIGGARFGSQRGACPFTRSANHYTDDWTSYKGASDEEILVWALIETPEAVTNIEEILVEPGLDGIVTGPFDLAHAMGHSGNVQHPEVQKALHDVVRKARACDREAVAVGFGSSPEEVGEEMQAWAASGCRVFVPALDRGILHIGLQNLISTTRKVNL